MCTDRTAISQSMADTSAFTVARINASLGHSA